MEEKWYNKEASKEAIMESGNFEGHYSFIFKKAFIR